jgi:outer membrane protein OmpA-like peptidoglycan-associated protein
MRLRFGLVVAALCLVASPARAQNRIDSFDLEQLYWNAAGNGGLLVGGSDLQRQGDARFSFFLSYSHNPFKYFEDRVLRATLVQHRWTAALSGSYGLTRWLEVNATLPVMLYQAGRTVRSELGETVFFPIGRQPSLATAWLSARAGFLREHDDHPMDLGLELAVGLPVGQRSNLTRERTVAFLPRLGAGKSFGQKFRLAADLAMFFRPGVSLLQALDANLADRLGRRMQLGVGASTLGDGVRYELSARTYFPLTNVPNSVEVMAGIRAPAGAFELFALGGPGFGNSPGTPEYRVILGASLRSKDPCKPDRAHSPAQCPELDDDRDGFLNRVDACPLEPGPGTRDGCPIRDRDGDGTLDDADACIDEPGLKERKGCPIRDADRDGVEDADDACLNEPGPVERKGCPIRDADKDGIEDADDACPNEPGVAELKGCPPKLVELDGKKLTLHENVYFDSDKATIQERSFALLRAVAQILRDHPELKKVAIDGHTDSSGSEKGNLRLSNARAKAVRDFLVSEGIDAGRLVPRGFGEAKPIADNETPEGKEKNRRVEFYSLEK